MKQVMKKMILAAAVTGTFAFSMGTASAVGATTANASQAVGTNVVEAPKNVVPMHKEQVPGYYRLMVGDYEVTALYDGPGDLNSSLMEHHTDMTKAELDEIMDKAGAPRTELGGLAGSINGYLVNTGDHLILVDSGKGEAEAPIFFDKEGRLVESLKAAGYKPSQVDAILTTHLHVDHIQGAVKEGKRVFKNATFYVQAQDKAFWVDTPLEQLPAAAHDFAKAARYTIGAYEEAGKVKIYNPGDNLFGEVKSIPLFGHTAGHTGFEFTSKGQSLLIWGDIMHNGFVQMSHPEVAIDFDSVDTMARQTRLSLLPQLAESNTIVAGAHLPFPGFGHIKKADNGDGYTWVPVSYIQFNKH